MSLIRAVSLSALFFVSTINAGYIYEANQSLINLKTNHIADVYNTQPFKQLRLDLVNGVKNDICSTCWDREKVGASSQRIFSNAQYGMDYEMYDDGAVLPDFTSIDVRFSNLCNFYYDV